MTIFRMLPHIVAFPQNEGSVFRGIRLPDSMEKRYGFSFFAPVFIVQKKGKTDFLRIFLIAIMGVVTIHILGILYMLFVATLRHAPMYLITSWISSQSGVQVLYDIFFSMIGIYFGRLSRSLLWIVMC